MVRLQPALLFLAASPGPAADKKEEDCRQPWLPRPK